MDDILSLPMVLLHRDLGSCNIIVDEATCRLIGVIDWAEAEVCPFGLNLHSLQSLTGKPSSAQRLDAIRRLQNSAGRLLGKL